MGTLVDFQGIIRVTMRGRGDLKNGKFGWHHLWIIPNIEGQNAN